MMWWWWILPAFVGAVGLAIFVGGLVWLIRGRIFGGSMRALVGALFLCIVGAVGLLGLDLQTYHRLVYERPVAILEVHQKAPRLFEATLTEPASSAGQTGSTNSYEIHGDEWRVEAKVLKWKPWANVLGLDTQYRLDRLSGRYQDTQSELYAPRSAYDLQPRPSNGVDLWLMARRYGKYVPVVDTLYGSGASMPMAEGARYEVWITQSGLIARPANPAANEAGASGWR
jgi:hypothetical protein